MQRLTRLDLLRELARGGKHDGVRSVGDDLLGHHRRLAHHVDQHRQHKRGGLGRAGCAVVRGGGVRVRVGVRLSAYAAVSARVHVHQQTCAHAYPARTQIARTHMRAHTHLARPRLGDADDVALAQAERDRRHLNRRRLLVAGLADRLSRSGHVSRVCCACVHAGRVRGSTRVRVSTCAAVTQARACMSTSGRPASSHAQAHAHARACDSYTGTRLHEHVGQARLVARTSTRTRARMRQLHRHAPA